MKPDSLHVFIGWDPREDSAAQVCAYSLLKHQGPASPVLRIEQLRLGDLRADGLYRRREITRSDGRRYDLIDGKPFSTDFSFSRFLTVQLARDSGSKWALFTDCDFMFRADIAGIFDDVARDPGKAVYCVKHVHAPAETEKMDGQAQQHYHRKNWSSLMLFDTEHPGNVQLTVDVVNRRPGAWLHALNWLPDSCIGGLDPRWNWLEGYDRLYPDHPPFAVHFTRGGPWFKGYENVAYADEWRAMAESVIPYEPKEPPA